MRTCIERNRPQGDVDEMVRMAVDPYTSEEGIARLKAYKGDIEEKISIGGYLEGYLRKRLGR